MSNVLIGIIGVILFIGLALAGALVLGSDFTTANSSSQAAAVAGQIQQTTNAIEMYRIKTGVSAIPLGTTAFLIPRFLKVAASNPTSAGQANSGSYLYSIHINNDALPDTDNEGGPLTGTYVMTAIGTDAKALSTCQALADSYNGGVIPVITTTDRNPDGRLGCGNASGTYVAYAKIAG